MLLSPVLRLLLLASLALNACTPPQPAAAPKAGAAALAANDEPLLPPILEVIRDPQDSQLYSIHIKPGIDGTAKLSILGSQPVKWVNQPPDKGIAIKKGGAEQVYQLRLGAAPPSTPVLASASAAPPDGGARVQLTFFDPAGHAVLNVASPFPVPSVAPAGAAVPVVEGTTTEGARVQSVVPPGAPAPVVEGSQP